MDLLSFLAHSNISSLGTLFCFSPSYTSFLLARIIKKKFTQAFERFCVIDTDESHMPLQGQLEMAFLGMQTCYWLVQEITHNASLLSYIKNYKGNNCVVFSATDEVAHTLKNVIRIEVPQHITYDLFMQLFAYCHDSNVKAYTAFAHKIFAVHTTISLESALLCMEYCMLLGTKSAEIFIHSWLPSLMVPEKSLFTLSSYFFAKKKQQFFQVWQALVHEYTDVFWTMYWSEQLFRASAYLALMQEKKYVQAKKAAYRLPFSFIQKDWKNLTSNELARAHDHIYTIDWNIKNGLNPHFEHFYLSFIL